MALRYDLPAFSRAVGEWPDKLEEAGVRAIRSAMARGVGVVIEKIDSSSTALPAPVDTGAMRSSVRSYNVPTGAILTVEAPHAIYMERGTKPHYPPIGPIWAWVARKIPTSSDKEALGIAFAIQHKIGEEGIEPRFFFRRAMRKIREKIVPEEMRAELQEPMF